MQLLAAAFVGAALVAPAPAPLHHSRSLGTPNHGRLVDGVKLPPEGEVFSTWDPVLKAAPNRPWRRWATDRTVDRVVTVLTEYRTDHPDAPRVLVGDLSRPNGGIFDNRYGGLGHFSHQNGLDADVYYPRKDRLERAARVPAQVDQVAGQDLVDRFVAAGAKYVFVGPRLHLTGPRKVVQKLAHHDDHLH